MKSIKQLTIIALAGAILVPASLQRAAAQENVVKLGLTPLLFTNVQLGYERALTNDLGVGLNFSMVPSRDVTGAMENVDFLTSAQFSYFSVTPEFRYYTAGEAPKGFYIGAFLKYARYRFQSSARHQLFDDNNVAVNTPDGTLLVNLDLKVPRIGGGFQMGVQWLIADVVSIDWTILGLGWGTVGIDGELTTDLTGYGEYLENFMGDFAGEEQTEIPSVGTLEVTTGDKVGFKLSGASTMMLRGGLAIGVAF